MHIEKVVKRNVKVNFAFDYLTSSKRVRHQAYIYIYIYIYIYNIYIYMYIYNIYI